MKVNKTLTFGLPPRSTNSPTITTPTKPSNIARPNGTWASSPPSTTSALSLRNTTLLQRALIHRTKTAGRTPWELSARFTRRVRLTQRVLPTYGLCTPTPPLAISSPSPSAPTTPSTCGLTTNSIRWKAVCSGYGTSWDQGYLGTSMHSVIRVNSVRRNGPSIFIVYGSRNMEKRKCRQFKVLLVSHKPSCTLKGEVVLVCAESPMTGRPLC
ncbi:hypothetical protein BDZ89DRAFT_271798 [Hymenopellis radicata]|nr:hypothetical protein BDZ89DRAFT_271798 [Hymenopellis radicata]